LAASGTSSPGSAAGAETNDPGIVFDPAVVVIEEAVLVSPPPLVHVTLTGGHVCRCWFLYPP